MIKNSFKNQSVIEFVYKIVVGDQMKKIILIEDDEILSSGIESYLSKNDFKVETCKSFEEAKIKINNSFDLAILDINLPDRDGINLMNTLRENNVRVIITTVKNDEKFIDPMVILKSRKMRKEYG